MSDATTQEPTFETIEVRAAGATGALWLNRPDELNPLSTETLTELPARRPEGRDGRWAGSGVQRRRRPRRVQR